MSIPTPEGVAIELTLAGLGSRSIAEAIDLVFKLCAVGVLALLFFGMFGSASGFIVVPLIGITMLLYDVLFEVLNGGRTLGKLANGLRVVRSSGRRVDLAASMIRNVLRLVDGPVPLLYVPSMIAVAVTKRNQRIGDIAADTIVIRERRAVDRFVPVGAARADVQAAAAARAVAGATWDVSAIPAGDLVPVRAFLERRHGLGRDARARLAAQLDRALRPSVGGADEQDPERFLEILYEAKRARG